MKKYIIVGCLSVFLGLSVYNISSTLDNMLYTSVVLVDTTLMVYDYQVGNRNYLLHPYFATFQEQFQYHYQKITCLQYVYNCILKGNLRDLSFR